MSQIIDKYDKISKTDNHIVKISVIFPWWSITKISIILASIC